MNSKDYKEAETAKNIRDSASSSQFYCVAFTWRLFLTRLTCRKPALKGGIESSQSRREKSQQED
jgi:hypothetical protein